MVTKNMTDQLFAQVSESIQMVFDLTSRIDERVKNLTEREKESEVQIEKLLAAQHSLELKIESLNHRVGNHDTRWSKIFDMIWKLALMLSAGFILYKLGFQAPP